MISLYGDQVVLRSQEGVQYKPNLQHIKPLNMPDPKEQDTQLKNVEPKPFETPPMAKDRGCLLWLTLCGSTLKNRILNAKYMIYFFKNC